MKLPISWLNEYVDTKSVSVQELADKLVNIGFEVEDIEYRAGKLDNIKTGKIIAIDKHSNAERLQVCQVSFGIVDGAEKVLQIVTAAKNIAVGDIVPVALDGASLFDGARIYNGELRGEKSFGMFCGGSELGVDEDWVHGGGVDGILILDKKTKLNKDIIEVLALNDYILDISLTANRPDCSSIYGMAREVAAVLKKNIKPLDLSYKASTVAANISKSQLSLHIENNSLCTRYLGTTIKDISVAPSNAAIKRRLSLMGQKSINSIVDITNYVLLEVGQPLHAFDKEKINGGIIVREAKQGETLALLNGETANLKSGMLVIADNNSPLALAGIMGGEPSSVTDSTREILLESAIFSKGNIRATARALGLKTDSSSRNEKGVDYLSADVGSNRALALIYKYGLGVIVKDRLEKSVAKPKAKIINTSVDSINALLGIKVPQKTMVDILTKLGFVVAASSDKQNGKLKITAPNFRTDIEDYPCIAEEVIRYYGYNNIIAAPLSCGEISCGGYSQKDKNISSIKAAAVGFGAYEAITYSFVSGKYLDNICVEKDSKLRAEIEILNPLTTDYSRMRTTLVGGMLTAVRQNEMRKTANFRLFEIAKVYKANQLPIKELPQEEDTLCVAYVGKSEDFYSIKAATIEILSLFKLQLKTEFKRTTADWLHPGIGADIVIEGNTIGSVGAVYPTVAKNFDISENVFVLELNLSSFIDKEPIKTIAELPSKFPPVLRDIALVVSKDIMVGDLLKTIKQTAGDILKSVELFDIYEGEQVEFGHKSVALTLTLQSSKNTLSEETITQTMDSIIVELDKAHSAKLRSV